MLTCIGFIVSSYFYERSFICLGVGDIAMLLCGVLNGTVFLLRKNRSPLKVLKSVFIFFHLFSTSKLN